MLNSKYRYWFGIALLALVILLVFQSGKENSNRPSTPPEVALVHDEITKPIAGAAQSNRAVEARSTEVLAIPGMWPEALKNAAQAPPNAAKFLESELAALEAGQKYTGNILHYTDLSHRCSMKRQVDKIPNVGGYFINATSARSIAWVDAYLTIHCPAFEALRPRLKDWVSQGDDDAWVWIDRDLRSMRENWANEYLNDPKNADLTLDRKHMFVMQPTYQLLKHAETLILYGTDVSQVEIGLRLFGGYDQHLGDPLSVPFESEDYPAIVDRFSERLMDLTAMVFYCRHRSGECAPQGFYTFINCLHRYICSDQFSVFRLWAEQYHPNELIFANNFVDAILKRRAELGSKLGGSN